MAAKFRNSRTRQSGRLTPNFRQVTIIGMGLLGASLSLAIKKHRLPGRVFGIYRSRRSMKIGRRLKLGHVPVLGLKREILNQADFVILALPVRSIKSELQKITPYLKPDALVMDVGSTKRDIMKTAGRLSRGIHFVGTHPMAGSEKKGPAFARADLFEGATCFVIRQGDKSSRKQCERFWRTIGSIPVAVTAESHDRIASSVSHLPHLTASALVLALASPSKKRMMKYAGTGFRDTTRVAASNAGLWLEIIESNRDFITGDIRTLIRELERLRHYIKRRDWRRLKSVLEQASKRRQAINS